MSQLNKSEKSLFSLQTWKQCGKFAQGNQKGTILLSSCECHLFLLVFMWSTKASEKFAKSSLCSAFGRGDFSSGSVSTLNNSGVSKDCCPLLSEQEKNKGIAMVYSAWCNIKGSNTCDCVLLLWLPHFQTWGRELKIWCVVLSIFFEKFHGVWKYDRTVTHVWYMSLIKLKTNKRKEK